MYLGADVGQNKYEVYVDLDRRRVAVRIPTLPYTYIVQLGEKEVKWIRMRLEEGAEFANAALVWVDFKRCTLNVALPFRREPPKLQPRRLLVVDVNALYNGVAYAVLEEGPVVKTGRFVVPSKAIHLAKRAIPQLQRACAKGKRHACRDAKRLQSKFYKILREFQIQTVKRLVGIALRKQAAVVVDAPDWDSLKELKEEGNLGVKKQLLNVGRLLKRLKHLAEWYGVPYAEERLYSTVCPWCDAKLNELNDRRMRCLQCGFEEERDVVPIHWAQRRYREIMSKVAAQATTASSQTPSFSPVCAVASAVS
ncbi:MAG: zinc ribbon domain-containing protein [Pyrobaculum sp.]